MPLFYTFDSNSRLRPKLTRYGKRALRRAERRKLKREDSCWYVS